VNVIVTEKFVVPPESLEKVGGFVMAGETVKELVTK
jgi:hypothetical protein